MVEIKDPIKPFRDGQVLEHWWQWLLVIVVAVSGLLGIIATVLTIWSRIKKAKKVNPKVPTLSSSVKARLQQLRSSSTKSTPSHCPTSTPTSFGAYLGALSDPLTPAQLKLFSQWDLLILDPNQNGIKGALPRLSIPETSHILARLDLPTIVGTMAVTDSQMKAALGKIWQAMQDIISQDGRAGRFTGLLVGSWEDAINVPLLDGLSELLSTSGYAIYLEISPPNFLEGLSRPKLDHYAGVVVRNGSIMPIGERRDFFAMEKMKSTTRAFVSQSCLRPFTVMMWETVDDSVELSHAVIRRSHQWSSYHGAINWIGSQASLTDATLNRRIEEPLAAFQWLKDQKIMKIHETLRTTRLLKPSSGVGSVADDAIAELANIFPSIHNVLHAKADHRDSDMESNSSGQTLAPQYADLDEATVLAHPEVHHSRDWLTFFERCATDPLSTSPSGSSYDGLGCFPVGFDATSEDYDLVLKSQQRLRRLGLLNPMPLTRLNDIGNQLNLFEKNAGTVQELLPAVRQKIKSLADILNSASATHDISDSLQVFTALDSGFKTPAGAYFWSVYENDRRSGALIIYISKNTTDVIGTVLHAYLSSKLVPRYQCFLAEYYLAQLQGGGTPLEKLPRRLEQDVALLTPSDIMLYLQHARFSQFDDKCPLLSKIRFASEEILLDLPSYQQLKALGNYDYIDGKISAEDLVIARLNWYKQFQALRLSPEEAFYIFDEINTEFCNVLHQRRYDALDAMSDSLAKLTSQPLDVYSDYLLFSIFCAVRKAAFEEVYLEVSDRNPLFNEYSDQSAAFAELFALGSRCETYFDVTPSAFGKLLSNKHRAYYDLPENQPPMWINNAPAFASAYAAAQTDIDPDEKASVMPSYRRFTFLSVFAIPALIDIILLTTTKRGLYLSAGMSDNDMQMATLALMISLLLSGAIGTWISIGGTYYLISMAFSAANLFVLTRLIGGLAITFAGGVIGFIVIAAVRTPGNAAVFFFYLIGFTSYLSVLALLAGYQFPGSSFLNGRYIIITLLPLLLVAPIITTFVPGHDSIIYPAMLLLFVSLLGLGARYVGSQWVTWYNHIKTLNDSDVRAWYVKNVLQGNDETLEEMSGPAALALCRDHMYEAVMREHRRPFYQPSKTDPLVKELAGCWDSTLFLLDWYCRVSDVKRPIPYSSTWNLETQVALDSMLQAQRGIRLHNSFIHWRTAGDEIGCGILYFLVALCDRWIVLFFGGQVTGLGLGVNGDLRVSIGFGLAYYLIGAVLLDYKAQHLHQTAQQSNPVSIRSAKYISEATIYDAQVKRKLYWNTLFRFLGVHVWALALAAGFVWIFDSNKYSVINLLAYVGAYTGLLLYQYNKIFAGPHAFLPLLSAVVLGFGTGIILKSVQPGYMWNDVISLATATWSAAFLSIKSAKIGLPSLKSYAVEASARKFHAYGGVGIDHEWSASELEAFYDTLRSRPRDQRFKIHAHDHPGTEIKSLLLSCHHQTLTQLALDAFPRAPYWTQKIVTAWEDNLIKVELVSMQSIVKDEADLRAISCMDNDVLTIFIASDTGGEGADMPNVSSNCRVIAETLLHACAEVLFDVSHQQSIIAESLLSCKAQEDEAYKVSECIKRAMPFDFSHAKMATFATSSRRDLLRSICMGVDAETAWDNLPHDIRALFLKRCMGEFRPFSVSEREWISANIPGESDCVLAALMARYDLGAVLAVRRYNYFRTEGPTRLVEKGYQQQTADIYYNDRRPQHNIAQSAFFVFLSLAIGPLRRLYHLVGKWIKFLVIATMADPEFHRELDCILGETSNFIRRPIIFILTGVWMYARVWQAVCLSAFLFHRRPVVRELYKTIKGTLITLKPGRLILRHLDKNSTAFIHQTNNGGFKLKFYDGIHKAEPKDGSKTISTFSKDLKLYSREEYEKGEVVNEYIYDYPSKAARRQSKISKHENPRIPLSRTCIRGKSEGAITQYNYKGHIESGSYMLQGNLVRFKYHYRKNAKYGDELLRAEFVLPHMSCNVSWCAPPVRHPEKMERWIPTSRVHEATFVQGADVFECSWLYDHKFHPTITTKANGQLIETPDMIKYDWLGVLKKPSQSSFLDENPLLDFSSIKPGFFGRLFGWNSKRLPVSTSKARSQLWKAWKKRTDLDGVVIRWIDERLLRQDPMLKTYWSCRDRGDLGRAEDYLAMHADAIMASAELTTDISAWTPLAMRMSDLFSFGQGGDAVVYTRTKTLQPDTEDTLHVIAVDTGTWPNEGGGVSACRRDLINNLRSIRWHMVVESANDFGLPKHQTEENVESLKVIPLWGLDFMHPTHGMFFNKLDSEVDLDIKGATLDDIKTNFIPTLTALVKGARAIDLNQADIKQATRALVNLNSYFQDSRHWKEVWTSQIVKDTWRYLWLTDDLENTKPPSEWFKTELPTLGHLDMALELWFRYLFIFSIPIPEEIPSVFQASHHSVSASYGIVCKIKRQCTLQIWDHAISWRETNLYLSSALCTMPPFIRNSLLGLMRLTATLTLHHADQVLPCADFFNPGWEVEIGSCSGSLEHRNRFRRKVDPIVNGITDMQKFAPVSEIKTKKPTVTMLSHVWFAKDIKTALLAADIILNQWGFKDYNLDIYGALNKAPVYSSECQELIACKGVGTNVTLRGTADPGAVLANTWLFLNSSVSEGLPLALGEAALTGAPVVCTDVGASLRVLTDPDDNERYSEVVAPNDPLSLARAQINILAMLGEWAAYADDDPDHPAPILPHNPTPKDVEIITRRMYEKADKRRELGMMARDIVQKSFSGDRYLREHEQMLWIGKSGYEMLGLGPRTAAPNMRTPRGKRAAAATSALDTAHEKMLHPKAPWLRHASTATSFSSMYFDEPNTSTSSAMVDWRNIPYGDDRGRSARPNGSRNTSRSPSGYISERSSSFNSDIEAAPLSPARYTRTSSQSPKRTSHVSFANQASPSRAPAARESSSRPTSSEGRLAPLSNRISSRLSYMSKRGTDYKPSGLHEVYIPEGPK